jgi:chemotaxis methyl-accepting protein methylase
MRGTTHNFSIYIPNCASGEDIISFAIIFDRLGFKNWHIHADAETEEKLSRAKKLYFEESKFDLCSHNFGVMFDKNLFAQYFTLSDRNYYFNLKIEDHITFSTDTIERRSNTRTFEIVYAANILSHYKPEGGRNIISSLYNATTMNGYLILGNLESIPNGFYNNMFTKADTKVPIYLKSK